jgi:hypothetical protein
MKITTVLNFALKIAGLTLLMSVLFATGTALTGVAAGASPRDAGGRVLALLTTCLVDTLLLSVFIIRSRLTGLRLVLATAVVYYGVKTFMTQVEVAYFMTNVTRDLLPRLFAMTLPTAVIFPPVATLLFGKLRGRALPQPDAGPEASLGEWAWKAALIGAVVYPVLFFGFGYFVAWRNPDVRAFYGGTDNASVIVYYAGTFARDPFLYPFEVLRGLLWFALALPVVRTLKGRPWQIALLLALLFALTENGQLLMPNSLMPASVRFSHFIETASENFILGWAIVGLSFWRPARSPRTAPAASGARL